MRSWACGEEGCARSFPAKEGTEGETERSFMQEGRMDSLREGENYKEKVSSNEGSRSGGRTLGSGFILNQFRVVKEAGWRKESFALKL